MGYYINPPNMTKEEFLLMHGTPANIRTQTFADCPEDCLPVILVDNGMFTAAAICPDGSEFEAFMLPTDHRPKIMFWVHKVHLEKYLGG